MVLRQTADELIPELARYQRQFLIAGGVGAAISLVGYFMNPGQFFQSYLMAYMFVLGLSLGSLALAMVHQLSGPIAPRKPASSAWLRPRPTNSTGPACGSTPSRRA